MSVKTPGGKTSGGKTPAVKTSGWGTPMLVLNDGTLPGELNVGDLFNRFEGWPMRDAESVPKIAIVGDKASGKTSIFEALTELSFSAVKRPVTNFAVHAQFRRTTGIASGMKAKILPGPLDSQFEAAVEHLEGFEVNVDGAFTGDGFNMILHEAASYMDIAISDSDDFEDDEAVEHEYDRQLSDNVLVLEIYGPKVQNLSIIDFPGFMHSSTHYNVLELRAIKNLAMAYFKDPQSILLFVVDATIPLREQESLRFVRHVDPHGHRTVGVLTKCDLVERGEENGVLRISLNEEFQLDRGWFAVKNRSVQERHEGYDLHQRNAAEDTFFTRYPWNKLSHNRAGIAPLREYLGGLEKPHPVSEHISEVSETSSSEENEDLEANVPKRRPTMLISSITVALTLCFALLLVALGCQELGQEIATDGDFTRLLLLITAPPQIFVSLFFCQSLINTVFQLLGPVSQLNTNSKFYSAKTVKRLKVKNGPLPHVTIQCPVYKEGIESVIEPTVESLEVAIRDYESHGGTANIFMNDDGMQLLSPEEAAERRAWYIDHKIGWVARPKHNPEGEGLKRFIRRGKFKKASNMNFALGISLKVEDKLVEIDREGPAVWTQAEEEEAYQRCLGEVLEEELGRAWAEGDIRIGDYILIIDSDTRVPVNCMIDAVSELEQSPQVAIIQFSCGVMNVTTSFFERGITFFTDLVYTAIRYAVANGDVSAFVGHNAFLRWSALQEVAFKDDKEDNAHDDDLAPEEKDPNSTTPYEKFWSESHVSEDFDISLRLQTQGYHIRMGAYCGGDFKEGVSLTVYDELARWEKYAYGCNELLFHPIKFWWRRGPLTPLFRTFLFSNMPIGSKITILAYVGTYYAIAYAWFGTFMNYFLLGWLNGHLDHYYMNSWRVWIALVVVFTGAGNLALAIVRYRGENFNLAYQLWTCFRWVPLLFIFLGGISMHVCQAILSHLFSIDMTWGATSKEATDTSFFVEVPSIVKRFKFVLLFCLAMAVMIVCGVYAFPYLWRINQVIAIFPLVCVIFAHFFLPVLLNPALMKFTW